MHLYISDIINNFHSYHLFAPIFNQITIDVTLCQPTIVHGLQSVTSFAIYLFLSWTDMKEILN